MTIDERVESLILPLYDDTNLMDVRQILRDALLEVARDQRTRCAVSLGGVNADGKLDSHTLDVAMEAVMNATLEAE